MHDVDMSISGFSIRCRKIMKSLLFQPTVWVDLGQAQVLGDQESVTQKMSRVYVKEFISG
jgi:hypothetical protein